MLRHDFHSCKLTGTAMDFWQIVLFTVLAHLFDQCIVHIHIKKAMYTSSCQFQATNHPTPPKPRSILNQSTFERISKYQNNPTEVAYAHTWSIDQQLTCWTHNINHPTRFPRRPRSAAAKQHTIEALLE